MNRQRKIPSAIQRCLAGIILLGVGNVRASRSAQGFNLCKVHVSGEDGEVNFNLGINDLSNY